MEKNWVMAFLVALLSDGIDYAFGFIPGYGDMLDIATAGILFWLTKSPVVLMGLVELVPAEDFIPTWVLVTGLAYTKRNSA